MTRKPPAILIAPGRELDELDAIMEQVRANSTIVKPLLRCDRCKTDKKASYFARSERRKIKPVCFACAGAGLQKAPQWVREAEAAEVPIKPLSGITAYRRAIAVAEEDAAKAKERAAKAEEDAAADAAIEGMEIEGARIDAERQAAWKRLEALYEEELDEPDFE